MLALARIKLDENFFLQSFDKYQKSISIKPDKHSAFNNWGSALLGIFQLTKNHEYLDQAKTVLGTAEKLDPDKVYNQACLYSILDENDNFREKLLHCKQSNTLPDKNFLMQDRDLDNIRNEPWFKELLNSIE